MSKYLLTSTEIYRVDSEPEATALINAAKNASEYDVRKYNSEKKDIKAGGEIVGDWYKVTIVKEFNDAKEPISIVDVTYEVE